MPHAPRRANTKLRTRLGALSTALLSDALGKTGAMDHDMRCLSAKSRMAGPAMTLRVHTADVLMVAQAVALSPRGSVLVIDGQGELNTALWGQLTTLTARGKGLEGVAVDGAIRDSAAIRREPFPVFARAIVPNAGGAEYPGEINVPIQCGGVVVNPDDWIVGDEDGVVVIPAGRLTAVIEIAERLRAIERKIEAKVRRGKDLATELRYDELLRGKSAATLPPQFRFTGR